MKYLVPIALALCASSVFAADCTSDVKSIAKSNLDQVAVKYGFESSDIGNAKLVRTKKVKITRKLKETLSVFSVEGYIYKGEYTVSVTVDESCAVRAVSIHDDSTL